MLKKVHPSGVRRRLRPLLAAALAFSLTACAVQRGYGPDEAPPPGDRAHGPGEVWSSGLNENGQLGRESREMDLSLGPVLGLGGKGRLRNVVAVAAGGRHSLAVLSDGRVVAWGANDHGQLGDGTRRDSRHPVLVRAPGSGKGHLRGAVAVAADSDFSMALLKDGRVVTWGKGDAGQRGIGRKEAPLLPTVVLRPDGRKPLTDVVQIAADGRTELVLRKDGSVLAWGANDYGMVGDGTRKQRSLPVRVRGLNGRRWLSGVSKIAIGGQHGLALLRDGRGVAWGRNELGQLGNGTRTDSTVPKPVSGVGGKGELSGIVAISAAEKHNFALTKNATLVAWGNNTAGQLGDGTLTLRDTPVNVVGTHGPLLQGVAQVHAGEAHGVAILSDGSALSWGAGRKGQLGWGKRLHRSRPGPLITVDGRAPSDVMTAAAGERHLLLLMAPQG